MAATTGTAASFVEEQLLANGERYAYFQAIRLLRLFGKADGNDGDMLRIRPRLTLGFPETDIDRIEKRPQGGYSITANFFGLYGVASPLPTYYTEDLLDEQREGRHATRDFLDIVHHAMYPLLFDAWSKYRLQRRVLEEGNTKVENQLYAFVGLDDPELRAGRPYTKDLLRYAGLFNLRPHSALGLKTLLRDAFRPAAVDIECCIPTVVPIPADQRLALGIQGHCLGENTYLGAEIDDVSSHLKIRLSDLSEALFHRLLPGEPDHERLRFLVDYYLNDPLKVSVELELRPGEASTARTSGGEGMKWSHLGLDTWLAPEASQRITQAKFNL